MDVNLKSVLSMITRRFGLKRCSLEERLQLQKIVYLLQAGGVRLGYGFGWNKYGPYSQELADDSYAVLSVGPEKYEETKNWSFDKDTEDKLKKIEDFLKDFKGDYKQLELLASVDFMCRIWDVNPESLDNFMEEFRSKKKKTLDGSRIEDEEVKKAIKLQQQLHELN